MTFLLDVNLLIALIDPAHVFHESAHRWFADEGAGDWATCPLTENGVVRVVGHSSYPNRPGSPALVSTLVANLRRHAGHQFWPDDISLVGSGYVDMTLVRSSAQVTDTYLLALARSRGGRLATMDRRLSVAPVSGGQETLRIIAT